MYKKGELRITTPCVLDRQGLCEHYMKPVLTDDDFTQPCSLSDSRADNSIEDVPIGTAFLPHSCNEWVIGGKEQIQALIDDLTALL